MTPDAASELSQKCYPDAPWSAEEVARLQAAKAGRFLSEKSGFVLAHCIPPEAEVLLIAVDPTVQRSGIGTTLLQKLAEEADTIFLEVAEDNTPACALYHRFGFEETGRRRGYYSRSNGTAVDAVLMTWTKPDATVAASPRIG